MHIYVDSNPERLNYYLLCFLPFIFKKLTIIGEQNQAVMFWAYEIIAFMAISSDILL